MQIAFLQLIPCLGDIQKNSTRIIRAMEDNAGADIYLCPVNSLCGTNLGSWANFSSFSHDVQHGLETIAKETQAALLLPAVFFGDGGKEEQSIYFVRRGRLKKVPMISVGPQGNESSQCVVTTGSILWNDTPITLLFVISRHFVHRPLQPFSFFNDPTSTCMLPKGRALFIFTLHPWWNGFERQLEEDARDIARSLRTHVLLANSVGIEDGKLYHGQSAAFDPLGGMLLRTRAFTESTVTCDLAERLCDITQHFPLDGTEAYLWSALVFGVREFVRAAGANSVYIGVSGGMDSAIVLALACEALGAEHVHAVFMPSPYTSKESERDVLLLASRFGVELVTIPIEPLMQAFSQALSPAFSTIPKREGDTTAENIQARIRAVLLCALANRAQALILNTSNKSELAMGYSTLYGDSIGALSVLGDVLKTEVYALAAWYNTAHPACAIPESILAKQPSAELKPNQKDSDSLPPYAELDPIILGILNGDDAPNYLRDALGKAEFKRRQAPVSLMVSQSAFGHVWRNPLSGRLAHSQ